MKACVSNKNLRESMTNCGKNFPVSRDGEHFVEGSVIQTAKRSRYPFLAELKSGKEIVFRSVFAPIFRWQAAGTVSFAPIDRQKRSNAGNRAKHLACKRNMSDGPRRMVTETRRYDRKIAVGDIRYLLSQKI